MSIVNYANFEQFFDFLPLDISPISFQEINHLAFLNCLSEIYQMLLPLGH
jgi:hypothetical protein